MNNYIPFGPEWEKEMMKIKKKELIALLKEALQESQSESSGSQGRQDIGDDLISALINTANSAKEFIIAYNKRNDIRSIHDIKDQYLIALVSTIETLDKLWAKSEKKSLSSINR